MTKYGTAWPDNSSPLEIEFACIRRGGRWVSSEGYVCGEGLYQHYLNAWLMLWPEDDHHRWAELGLKRIAEHEINVFMGPGDSNKTFLISKFVMCDYWADPLKTLWLVSSTDRRGAELRIWGKIKEFFNRAKERFPWLLGRVLESKGCITPDEISEDGELARLLTRGIIFIPCFPSGTLVDTPEGRKPIETVNAGDEVIGALGVQKVKVRTERIAPELVRVTFHDGRTVDCTPEHLFFTSQGWRPAVALSKGVWVMSPDETLQIVREGIRASTQDPEVLLREVSELGAAKDLSELQKDLHPLSSKGFSLFCSLFRELDLQGPGKAGAISKILGNKGLGNSQAENAGELSEQPQGTVAAKCVHEAALETEGKIGRGSFWRNWIGQWKDAFRSYFNRLIPRCGIQLQNQNRTGIQSGEGSPLLPGFGMARSETCGGNRRELSPERETSGQGSDEGSFPGGSWVARVSRISRTGDPRCNESEGGYRVFNFEVEAHPSYSVNGFVVHNCKQGNTWLGLGPYAGIKPPTNGRLGHAGDECSLMHPTFLDAYANWYGKNNFRGLLTGNPGDLEDPLCMASEPVDGWDSWKDNGKTQEWKSKFYDAWVVAYDGRDTPNNDFPYVAGKPRFPYLIGNKKLEAVKAQYGENDWHWWNQCVGKPQTSVQSRRVITRQLTESCQAFDDVIWESSERITKLCALDAAYGGVGGDRCVIMPGAFGAEVSGKEVIVPDSYELVPVSIKNEETPEIQIARYCKAYCESRGIPPSHFFFDGRGTLAMAMAREWSPEVNVVDFGGPATSRPVANDMFDWDGDTLTKRLKLCNEHYANFVTELWFSVYYTVLSKQLRRLQKDVAREGYQRTWEMKKGNRRQVEPKAEMKLRTTHSPDLFDTLVTLLEGARRLGFQIQAIRVNDNTPGKNDAWLRKELDKKRQFLKSSSLSYANE